MESNDDNIDSTEDSNSVSTDLKTETTQISREKVTKKNTNIVFVSPNELENWEIEEESKPKIAKKSSKQSKHNQNSSTSIAPTKVSQKPKNPKSTPKSLRKKRGRPKRKKIQNPWSSDVEDENIGLENEISDDEYFRRLEEASEVYGSTTEVLEPMTVDSVDPQEEEDDEEEEIYIGQMKTFDLNNSDLLNYILSERENSLHINDPSKPQINLPQSSSDLKCPRDCVLQLLSIYETVIQYHKILRISPFKIEDFITAMITNENSVLLSEIHISILKLLLREDEIANTSLCPLDQKDGINLAFHLIDSMTWPELLRFYVKSIDYKSQKIHISDCYPFVTIYDRIGVLTFLLDLFVLGVSVRNEIARENVITHEDFCRVCHTSGEVLCCDTCSAVYHLDCLTPQLTSVPTTTWNCPICVRHKIPGLFDCNFDGEKALIEHKKTPLGQDRFGNTYWFIARRLIIEPRNDNIQNLVESILERDEEKDFEPVYDNVSYYSTFNSLELVRSQLNRDWEAELCDVFDSLIDEMNKSMSVTVKLTKVGLEKFKKEISTDKEIVVILDEELKQFGRSIENNSENSSLILESIEQKTRPEPKFVLKTLSGQPVGVVEDQEGLLVRNVDGSTVRVRLSAKTRSNQLEEVAAMFNCEIDEENLIQYRLGDEGDWRFYENLYVSEFIALSKFQHQEDKDRKRILGNKYSLNECNEFQWYVSQPINRAGWFNCPSVINRRPVNDILGGPLNMLQCLRLTLQNMESQMFSSFMCPAWKSERKNWLINIQRTRNAASLGDFVAIFESAIRGCCLKKSWTNSLGFLYLDRITAAEREEEKRIKNLERKTDRKPEGELVRTRNPGLLKHTIWKTKGEEYRRASGDGWSWLSVSIVYNPHKIRDFTENVFTKKAELIENNSHYLDLNDLIDISANVDNETLYPRNKILNNNNNSQLIDKLINVRLGELEAAKKEFDLEEAKRKLKELTNQRNEIRERKEQLEEKLGVLSKNYNRLVQYKTQHHNRKRLFPNYDQSFNNSGEKRMRYQNENSPFLSQYDGADDEDISSSKEVQTHIPVTIVSSNNDNPVVGNVNAKPIVINNTNNIRGLCVLNIGQNNNNQNQNRIMLNQPQQFKILRLGNNQIRLVTPTGNNPGTQQIRKFNVGGPQFVLVNNMSNIGQTSTVHSSSISNGHAINQSNVIYTPNNGMQVPIRIATPNSNQQQYKRLLPMEPAMMQQKQLPNIQNNPNPTNTQLYSNVMVGTSRMSTPVQGRRTISKVTHNTDNRIVSNTDSNDELVQRKEMDNLCNEILSLDQQLDQLDKHIAELENKIEQVTMDVSESYKLHKKSPIVDSVFKTDTEQDRQLPHRNPYKWPVDTKQFVRSVFLYKSDCLRPLILTAGRIEVPGFDVEKKRLNNIYWPYPTSRPNFSATWRYQVSRVCNSDDLDDRIFDLAATEPVVDPDHEKLKNVGSSGLSCLALCMKILWYSLRWDDMLTNWQGSNIATSITLSQGIFKETLATGETVERKIIGWKPLDKYCSQCSYLVTICTTTTTVDSPSSTRSRGRTNRRGRQRASARYTDIDYFTDDGEIDSEDSDPNFIPGVSRAGRTRGRRPRNRINDDFQAIKLPEKKFKEEWMDEDILELWEIRDYLMSISWRRFVFAQTKNQSQIVSSIMNKREFQRIDNSTQSSQILSHRNVLTSSIIPNTVTHNTVTPIAISTVNNENIIRSVTTPLNIIAKTEISTEKPSQLSDPKTIEEPVSLKPEINLINSEKSVETKILTKPENLPSKLIIESASTAVKTLSTLGDNSGGIIGTPNNIIKTLPVPITDIREISRSEPHPTRGRSLRSRGRGRGRGRPPMQRSISSQSEDTKFDDVVLDMDSTMSAISDRINSTKQNFIDIEVIKALNKADDLHFSELAKKESKKIKKHRKEQYKDSSEELTDREVETGSTSPAIDSQICEDPEPKTPIPITNRSTNHNKRSFSKRRNRSKHTKDSSDDSEGSDSDRQTIGQRSESNDQNSIQDPPKKRSRKHSSDYSTSPKRSNKSKSKKVEAEEETQEKELYCICKTYDPTQKYIGCDYCERWFHFSCVQMTGKKVSSIDMWKCQICQQKENDQIYCKCQTKYDPSKLYIGCDFCDEWYHPQCIGMTDSEANNYQGNYMCPSCKQSKKKKKKSEESSTSNSNNIDYEKKVNPDIRRKLSELLNKMMKHKSAIYFLKPVDVKACPGYYQVVRSPMDLSTAKTNLDKMKYSTIGSFKLDMHKIFTACRIYFDESSKEYQSADKLEDYFLTELREIY